MFFGSPECLFRAASRLMDQKNYLSQLFPLLNWHHTSRNAPSGGERDEQTLIVSWDFYSVFPCKDVSNGSFRGFRRERRSCTKKR
ncbi:hypothetical protein [Rubritalea tangerina]|uniref:hypothetical protein n=1 Tax=Rubritalea tangerina TaxID=430798 RepID=UPI0036167D07